MVYTDKVRRFYEITSYLFFYFRLKISLAAEEAQNSTHYYKPQNKMFHFCKTFCSKITLVNTIQNVI